MSGVRKKFQKKNERQGRFSEPFSVSTPTTPTNAAATRLQAVTSVNKKSKQQQKKQKKRRRKKGEEEEEEEEGLAVSALE